MWLWILTLFTLGQCRPSWNFHDGLEDFGPIIDGGRRLETRELDESGRERRIFDSGPQIGVSGGVSHLSYELSLKPGVNMMNLDATPGIDEIVCEWMQMKVGFKMILMRDIDTESATRITSRLQRGVFVVGNSDWGCHPTRDASSVEPVWIKLTQGATINSRFPHVLLLQGVRAVMTDAVHEAEILFRYVPPSALVNHSTSFVGDHDHAADADAFHRKLWDPGPIVSADDDMYAPAPPKTSDSTLSVGLNLPVNCWNPGVVVLPPEDWAQQVRDKCSNSWVTPVLLAEWSGSNKAFHPVLPPRRSGFYSSDPAPMTPLKDTLGSWKDLVTPSKYAKDLKVRLWCKKCYMVFGAGLTYRQKVVDGDLRILSLSLSGQFLVNLDFELTGGVEGTKDFWPEILKERNLGKAIQLSAGGIPITIEPKYGLGGHVRSRAFGQVMASFGAHLAGQLTVGFKYEKHKGFSTIVEKHMPADIHPFAVTGQLGGFIEAGITPVINLKVGVGVAGIATAGLPIRIRLGPYLQFGAKVQVTTGASCNGVVFSVLAKLQAFVNVEGGVLTVAGWEKEWDFAKWNSPPIILLPIVKLYSKCWTWQSMPVQWSHRYTDGAIPIHQNGVIDEEGSLETHGIHVPVSPCDRIAGGGVAQYVLDCYAYGSRSNLVQGRTEHGAENTILNDDKVLALMDPHLCVKANPPIPGLPYTYKFGNMPIQATECSLHEAVKVEEARQTEGSTPKYIPPYYMCVCNTAPADASSTSEEVSHSEAQCGSPAGSGGFDFSSTYGDFTQWQRRRLGRSSNSSDTTARTTWQQDQRNAQSAAANMCVIGYADEDASKLITTSGKTHGGSSSAPASESSNSASAAPQVASSPLTSPPLPVPSSSNTGSSRGRGCPGH